MPTVIPLKEYDVSNQLSECDLLKLTHFLAKNKLNHVFKITPNNLETSSWVGAVKCGKIQIEVLPKLLSSHNYCNNKSVILSNLLYMLSFTHNLDIKTTDTAKLSECTNPFLEILIREYAVSLFEGLKKQTPKSYIRQLENLGYIKGKLNINQQIKSNCCNEARFFCEFDEFSEDNILNQLFYYVSNCLYKVSEDGYNKKILSLIKNYYADISNVTISLSKALKVKLFRNQQIFKKPLKLAKMFMEHSSIDMSQNKIENIALLWDMNQLFEEFIFELMATKCTSADIQVKYQKGRRLLRNDNSKKRNTFIDIYIEKGKEKIILDTKYKLFKNLDSFSNADVFQVSTYCLLHDANKAILIYPQWKEKLEISPFFLNTVDKNKNYEISFKTVNLQKDLHRHLEDVVTEIKEIIGISEPL